MSRKILKILISLLFLIVIALAAFAIKTFMPDLFDTVEKYGVAPSEHLSNI
ncbi:MAG: hypothetical protein J5594_00320 [Elusimicrobiaceae bacterium]|nr:hypothetical protein [Elusimicrobiaceae bacterium]